MTFEISQNQVTENTEHTEMVIQDFVPLVEIKTEAEPAVIETQKEIDMGTSIIPMDFPEIKKEEVVDFTVITSTAPAMEDSKPAIIDFNTPSGDLSSSKPEVVIDFNVQNTLPEIQENNEITPLTDSDIPNKEISIPVIQEEQVKQPQPRIIIEEPSYMRYIKFAVLPVILASFAAGYYFAGQSNTNLPPSDIKLPDPVVRIEKTSEWLLGPDTKITVEDNGTNIEQPYSKWAEILQNIKSTNPSYKFMVKSIDGIPMSKEVSIQDMERAIVPQNGSK